MKKSNEQRKANNIPLKSIFMATVLAVAVPFMTGCSTLNSDIETNTQYFNDVATLDTRLDALQVGMSKAEVFETLGMDEGDMQSLDRKDIKVALYGSEDQVIQGTEAEVRAFFSDMEGLQFDYENIERKRTFRGLLKIQTEDVGHDLSVTLVFKNGELYENPVRSGGKVNSKDRDPIIKPNNIIGATL